LEWRREQKVNVPFADAMDEQKNEDIVLTPDEARVDDSKEADNKKDKILDKLILDENDGVKNTDGSGEQVLRDSLEKASNALIAFVRKA